MSTGALLLITPLPRHAYGHGVACLLHSPAEHGKIFFFADGSQVDHVGNVGEQRYVKQPEVGNIVHAPYRCGEYADDGRVVVDTEVLRELVVGALQESAVHPVHGTASAGSDARSQCHGVFFGNTYVDKLAAGLLTAFGREAEYGRCSRGDGHNLPVSLHLVEQEGPGEFAVVFALFGNFYLARREVERHAPMETLLLFLGRA